MSHSRANVVHKLSAASFWHEIWVAPSRRRAYNSFVRYNLIQKTAVRERMEEKGNRTIAEGASPRGETLRQKDRTDSYFLKSEGHNECSSTEGAKTAQDILSCQISQVNDRGRAQTMMLHAPFLFGD